MPRVLTYFMLTHGVLLIEQRLASVYCNSSLIHPNCSDSCKVATSYHCNGRVRERSCTRCSSAGATKAARRTSTRCVLAFVKTLESMIPFQIMIPYQIRSLRSIIRSMVVWSVHFTESTGSTGGQHKDAWYAHTPQMRRQHRQNGRCCSRVGDQK